MTSTKVGDGRNVRWLLVLGAVSLVAPWPREANGGPRLEFQNAGESLSEGELAIVGRLTQDLAARAEKRLATPNGSQLIVRVTSTPRISVAICGAPPAIELDAAVIRSYVAKRNREDGEMSIAFMFAHELGHLPECEQGAKAEIEADKYARRLLADAYGTKAEYFLTHPVELPAHYAKESLVTRARAIDSSQALVQWANDCLRAEELVIRTGRVFSDFMNTELALSVNGRIGNKWYGSLPVNCAEYLQVLIDRYPRFNVEALGPLQEHALALNGLLLEYLSAQEQTDRQGLVATYKLWRGAAKGWAVPAVAIEGEQQSDFAFVGWRLSYMYMMLRSQFFNPSVRIAFRELRLSTAAEGTGAGQVAARTFGLEAVNMFVIPMSANLAFGIVPSLGWEMDVQSRAPWHRGRHRLIAGGEFVVGINVARHVTLLVGASARAPLVPEPGKGYSLVLPIGLGLH